MKKIGTFLCCYAIATAAYYLFLMTASLNFSSELKYWIADVLAVQFVIMLDPRFGLMVAVLYFTLRGQWVFMPARKTDKSEQ